MATEEEPPSWLQNSSFNSTILSLQQDKETHKLPDYRVQLLAEAETSSDEAGSGSGVTASQKRKRGSDPNSKQKREKHGKHKKHRHKSKEEERLSELDARARATGPRAARLQPHFHWAEEAERLSNADTECIDVQRENDNLVYQKPYLMNIPVYRKIIPRDSARSGGWGDNALQADPRHRKRQRFTTKSVKRLEQDKSIARLKFVRGQSSLDIQGPAAATRLNLPLPTFIPVARDETSDGSIGLAEVAAESEQESMRRQTAAFNRATVEQPEDLQNWLDFAAFQDKVFGLETARRERRARLERDAAEKKVDILQRARHYHPHSDEILLQLLAATRVFEDQSETKERWQDALRDPVYKKSWRLWRAFTEWQKCEYLGLIRGPITVKDVRQAYAGAMKAVARERLRCIKEQASSLIAEADEALVEFLVAACQFDLQSGYIELAVARIQAALEFAILAPGWSTAVPGPGGDSVRKQLFEQFWDSGAPLVGEEGGNGWQAWAITQQAAPPILSTDLPEEEEEPRGWSGWKELDVGPDAEPPADDAMDASDSDDDEDAAAEQAVEDDYEAEREKYSRLLEEEVAGLQLGDRISQEVFDEWLRWEQYRERRMWQPTRPHPDSADKLAEDRSEEQEENGQLVSYSEVEAGIFSLVHEGARRSLVLRLLALLDTPLAHWECSNSESALQAANSTASLSPTVAVLLLRRTSQDALGPGLVDTALRWLSPDWVFAGADAPLFRENGALPWFQADESRRMFLFRMLAALVQHSYLSEDPVLCSTVVAVAASPSLDTRNPAGEEAATEEHEVLPVEVFEDKGRLDAGPEVSVLQHDSVAVVREAVSGLLRAHSQGSPLWTAYAAFEAQHGNIKKARKSFNFYLVNKSKASPGGAGAAPLALAYARAEVGRKASNYAAVALHVLAWLGCRSGSFQPPDDKLTTPPSESRVAQTRRGFQGHLSRIAAHARAGLTVDEGALISAAALFEQLLAGSGRDSSGVLSACRLLRNAIAEIPLEVRKSSVVAEQLTLDLCTMLADAFRSNAVAPKVARSALADAVQVFPRSVGLLQLLIEVEQRSFMMSQLRMRISLACNEHHFVPLWLLAAKLEASQLLSQHHIKQLFRRAEKHEALNRSPLWRRTCFAHSTFRKEGNLDVLFARLCDRCPWVKEIWLDGLKVLGPDKFRLAEIERKDIRLRASIEEVVYAMAGKRIEQKTLQL